MKNIFAFFLSLSLSLGIFAQPSVGGRPIGLKDSRFQAGTSIKLPSVDNAELLEQDRQAAEMGEKALRFGLDFPVSISVNSILP
jgi:hypothetical protein